MGHLSSGGTEPAEGSGVLARTGAQVAEAVQRLSQEHCLPAEPEEGSFWLELQEAVRAAYEARARGSGSRRGRAIIMAGAPGAGKSRAVAVAGQALGGREAAGLGLDEAGFTTVDADDVKQLLLGSAVEGLEVDPGLLERARAHWQDLLEEQAPEVLADGRPLARGELATLVHQMSTSTADLVRQDLLAKRFDVKIEGTLQWMESPTRGQGPRLLGELKAAEYQQVVVVVADTPRQVCEQGAFQRWAGPRAAGDPRARFTPRSAVASAFQDTTQGEVCRCTDNARATHQLATRVKALARADLVVVRRREGLPTLVEHVDRQGRARTYQAGARQASLPGPAQPRPLSPGQVLASLKDAASFRRQASRPPRHSRTPPRNTLGR